MSPITASWYHVLLFLAGTATTKTKVNEKNYRRIDVKPAYIYALLLLPVLGIYTLSNYQLEHLFITYAYVMFYKQVMHVIKTEGKSESEMSRSILPLAISSLIILMNYNKFPRSHKTMAMMYAYILFLMYVVTATRHGSVHDSVQDLVMTHVFFFISKSIPF